MKCRQCRNSCIKKGIRNNKQRYQCKGCKKYQQNKYMRKPISRKKYKEVSALHREGNSISGIGRLKNISKSSVQRLIERLAKGLARPVFNEQGESYEIDEMRTFCGNKKNECWLIYAINRRTRQVIDLMVGRRTKENIQKVLDSVLKLSPKHIYSDKLNIYEILLQKPVHKIYPKCTNHIERMNLTLRTQLKRLGRKTICYSKSEEMLLNSVRIYFYGRK